MAPRTHSIFERVADVDNLRRAWEVVRANDLQDGIPAPSVTHFAEGVDVRLAELCAQLAGGTYQPAPLGEFILRVEDHDDRELHIPAVRDRVVERTIVDVLTPAIDPWFSPWSFGYRPGHGTADAIRALVDERELGCQFVARTDIRRCFDRLPRMRVLGELARWVDDQRLLALVDSLLARPVRSDRGMQRTDIGLPQGGRLSPLLCNIYLHTFDLSMLRHGLHGIRYGDDIIVAARTATHAAKALAVTEVALSELDLEVSEGKTAVMSFADGFAFLGEDISKSFPPADPLGPIREPSRKALYVARDGATVRLAREQIHVSLDDKDLLVVPARQVGSICVFGNVGLSAGARQFALANGVDVYFASRRGWFQGWLQAAGTGNIALRRLQYRQSDDPVFAARLARRFIVGKVANLAALLRRYGNADGAADVVRTGHELERFAETALECDDVASLVGIEGAATAAYFRAFAGLFPQPFAFTGRTRRPPTDPVNAALSYGYTVVTGATLTAVAMAGLDPEAGFLHLDSRNRPSLALDLLEEYRPLVVDTTVLRLFRKHTLTADQFRTEAASQAVLLTDAGRRALLGAIEQRLLTLTSHIPSHNRVSYRRSMFLQAQQIAACIRQPATVYQAMSWR